MHLVLEVLVKHIEDGSGEAPEEEKGGYQYIDWCRFSHGYFSFVSISFQIPAAQAPPTNGPTMKIHKLARAVPPWKMAGAKERAGLTDVPV